MPDMATFMQQFQHVGPVAGAAPAMPGAPAAAPAVDGQVDAASAPHAGSDFVPALEAPQQVDPNLHGDDYLKTLTPVRANLVKLYSEGKLQAPSGFSMAKPMMQKLLADTMQYDPTFDPSKAGARYSLRKDYEGGGKQFQELNAISTVAGHLNDLMKTADNLHNFSGLGPLNGVANNVLLGYREASQDPRIAQFNTVKSAVTRELTKAYQGGHITDSSVAEWQQSLNAAQTPEQLKTVIGQLNDLLSSKRLALEEMYRTTMGRNAPLPENFSSVNDRTRNIFNNVAAWSHGLPPGSLDDGASGAGAPAAPAAPAPGNYVYDPTAKKLVPQR